MKLQISVPLGFFAAQFGAVLKLEGFSTTTMIAKIQKQKQKTTTTTNYYNISVTADPDVA